MTLELQPLGWALPGAHVALELLPLGWTLSSAQVVLGFCLWVGDKWCLGHGS